MRKAKWASLGLAIVVGALGANGAAAAAGEIVFYSSVPRNLSDALVKGFEAKLPDIKVTMSQAGVETLLEKLELEIRATGRPKADVLWIQEPAAMDGFARRGLLEAYAPKDAEQIPAGYRDKEGHWAGTFVTHAILMYSTRAVPKDKAPRSWKDMADPRFKGKLVLANPRISGTGAAVVSAMLQHHGWKFWEEVARNRPLIAAGHPAMVSTIIAGERHLGPMLDYSIFEAARKGQPIGFAFPEEGAIAVGAYVGIVKGTKALDAARRFADFFASKDAAALIRPLGMYHTRVDAAAPEGWPPIAEVKLLPFNWAEHEKNKPEMKKRFADLMER
jgi:iron(III) transport system substrate-binding protein